MTKEHEEEFTIKIVQLSQCDEVIAYIKKHFYPLEALEQGLYATFEDLEDFYTTGVKEWIAAGITIGIFHASGNLIGICLNTILSKKNTGGDIETYNVGKEKNEKADMLRLILNDVERRANVFGDAYVEKVLEIIVLSVAKEFTGRGISYKLIKESERLAVEQHGCHIAHTLATGLGSQYIFQKCGYDVIEKIFYDKIELKGKKVLDLSVMCGATFQTIYRKDFRNKIEELKHKNDLD